MRHGKGGRALSGLDLWDVVSPYTEIAAIEVPVGLSFASGCNPAASLDTNLAVALLGLPGPENQDILEFRISPNTESHRDSGTSRNDDMAGRSSSFGSLASASRVEVPQAWASMRVELLQRTPEQNPTNPQYEPCSFVVWTKCSSSKPCDFIQSSSMNLLM